MGRGAETKSSITVTFSCAIPIHQDTIVYRLCRVSILFSIRFHWTNLSYKRCELPANEFVQFMSFRDLMRLFRSGAVCRTTTGGR